MIIPRKKCETFLRFSLKGGGRKNNELDPSVVTRRRMVKRPDDDILQRKRAGRGGDGYILHGIRRLKGGYEFGK